ncbi:MAG: oligosaccharide flippase family protein, partial [Stellaceae bacterium]
MSRFLPGGIGFFVAAALTRLLAPEQYGLYGLASGTAQILSLSVFGWIGLSLTRLAAGRTPDAHLVGSVLALFGALAVVVLLASVLALAWPLGAGNAHLVIATALGGIALAYFDLKSAAYTAAFAFARLLVLNLVRSVAMAAATIAAAKYFGGGLLTFLGSSAAMLLVCLLWRNRASRLELSVDATTVKRIVGFGLPIALGLLLFAAAGWGDRIVLGAESGVAAVGFYSAAAVLIQNTLQFASQAIGSAAYPLAVRSYENDERSVCDRQLEQNL